MRVARELQLADAHLDDWRSRRILTGYRLSPEEAFQVGKALFIHRATLNGAHSEGGAR